MVPFHHSKLLNKYSGNVTHADREIRMQEIVESIQKTLAHPYTGYLFIFYHDPKLISYLERQKLKMWEKVVFIPNYSDTISSLFRYANENLKDNVVMITNADIIPAEGFDKLNFTYLINNKVVYLLSR